jgi:Ca2+/Na+ antiporter
VTWLQEYRERKLYESSNTVPLLEEERERREGKRVKSSKSWLLRLVINMNKSYQKVVEQKKKALRKEHNEEKWQDKSFVHKLDFILELPFIYIRKFTIPPCEFDEFDNRWVILWPWLGIPVIAAISLNQFPNSQAWLYYVPYACVWSGIFLYQQGWKEGRPEDLKGMFIVQLVGSFVGFAWTSYVSGILIDILGFIGVISKLSPTYLALTIIGVGNALPDALITIALAAEGQAQMGITGSYAGQLFGLLIGFGLAMLKIALKQGHPVKVDIFPLESSTLLDLIVMLTTLAVLVVTFAIGLLNNFNFGGGNAAKNSQGGAGQPHRLDFDEIRSLNIQDPDDENVRSEGEKHHHRKKPNYFLAYTLGALYISFVLGATYLAVKNAWFPKEK